MAAISFSVLHNALVKSAPLSLEQIDVEIDISGPKPDPLTLQQIRDNEGINQSFNARRKRINELVFNANAAMKKAKTEDAAQTLLKDFNKELAKEVAALEKELQSRIDTFTAKQKKEVNDLFWARAKLSCKVVYSLGKLIKSGLEAAGKVAAAVAGPGIFIGVVAIKSLIAAGMDLKGAYNQVVDALDDERTQFAKIQAAVKNLKALKAPKPVPQGDIDALEAMLGPYGARLLGVDSAAKAAATQLDKQLTALEKAKFRDAKGQKAAEQMVEKMIDQIIELSKNVAEGRKLLQSARSKLVDVAKRAKAEPTSWWDYAPSLWKLVDAMVDMREESLEAAGFKETFAKCHGVFAAKLQDEMLDAVSEEATK